MVQGRLALRLLDSFCLEHDGAPVPLSGAPQRVLACVAVQGPAHRRLLAERLWPDAAASSARGSLRTALWSVNHRAPGVLAIRQEVLRLDPAVDVDLHRFRSAARRVVAFSSDLDECGGTASLLGEMAGQELLPGWDDEWLVAEREQVRQMRLHALEACSADLLRRGRHAAALEVALEAVGMEPLRETSNAAVIAAHMHERNVAEALRHYESFRQLLWDELGCLPSEDLRRELPVPARRGARST